MKLRLKYPPIPEHATDFARDIVQSVRTHDGVELDYSPESLAFIDELIQSFKDDGAEETDCAETLFCLGCYVGEVLRFELGGRWVAAAETPQPDVFTFPLVLSVGRTWWNPIGKAFKRLEGPDDSVAFLFRVAQDRLARESAS